MPNITDEKLVYLLKLAREAYPGPWYKMFREPKFKGDSGGYDISADDEHGTFSVAEMHSCDQEANRDFIIELRNVAEDLILEILEGRGIDIAGDEE